MNSMNSEEELLLRCARCRMDAENRERIQSLISGDLDCTFLIDTALQHGMMPLLYKRLHAFREDAVSKCGMSRLKKLFYTNALQNITKTEELIQLLDLFREDGIAAIPYKGPVLAASAYGGVSFRQFNDLDIFIHRKDFGRAQELLIFRGYRPELQLRPSQERAFLRAQRDIAFFKDNGRTVVELQWVLPPVHFPLSLDHSLLWKRAESVTLEEKEVLTLSPEDTLLILCIHGLYHCWERAEWICDVAWLVDAHQEMNWNRMMEETHALGCQRLLFLGLRLAHELFDAPVPPQIIEKVHADRAVKQAASQIADSLFPGKDSTSGAVKCMFTQLRMWKSPRRKISFWARLAFTTNANDWASASLPAAFSFLYPLLRPFRLLKKYGKGLLR